MDVSQPVSPAQLNGRFLLVCVGVWLYAVDSLVTATVAPAIILEIGGVAYINWTIALYEVGAIIAGALAASLCDHLGVRRVLTAAALLYGIGCVMAALAPTMGVLLSGRLVQGLGGGMLLSLCYIATYEWFPKSLWNRLFGIVAFIWGAGSLLGPLIGGFFANYLTWRGCFWLFAIQAGVLGLASAVWLPANAVSTRDAQKWPVLPLILLSAATILIAQAGLAAKSVTMMVSCTVGAALLYMAARVDRESRSRLLPVQLTDIRHPVGAGLLMVFSLAAATTGFWTYGPLILNILFGTNPLISGYILAAEALAWSLATIGIATAPAVAETTLIRAGACIVAMGAAGFAIAVPSGSLIGMVVCAILQGAGFGICWPSIVLRIVRFSDESEKSLGSAAPSTIQRIGYAVGTAAAGMAASFSGLTEGMSAIAAKTAGFWVFAAFVPVLGVALLSAWLFTLEEG